MILNLVSLNTEEDQAALFTFSKPESLHSSPSPCYFRSALDDSFSHWHTNHPNPLPPAFASTSWETKEKHPLSPLITERGGNWSSNSISKISMVSQPPALTKSAVHTPSSSHEVFVIPDLICSATAHSSQIPDQILHSILLCCILHLVTPHRLASYFISSVQLCSVFKWMISEGLYCIRGF